jgi:hypothetical protein
VLPNRRRELIKVGKEGSTNRSDFSTVASCARSLTPLRGWRGAFPKSEHEMKRAQAAAHCVTVVPENGAPMMFARIGMMRTINRHQVKEFTSSKTTHWRNAN